MTTHNEGQHQQDSQDTEFALPDEMTASCLQFFHANAEMWALMEDFAKLAYAQEQLLTALAEDKNFKKAISEDYREYRERLGNPEGEPEELDSEAFFKALRDIAPRANHVVGRHARLLNQMFLSRAVDNFLLYLTELLLLTYRTKLGAVSNQGTEIEEFIASLVEQYVEGASLGGMKRLPSEFKNTFGIKLFTAQEEKQVGRIIARRNVITHHRGIADRYFLRQLPGSVLKVGDPVPFEWTEVQADARFLLNLVVAVDGRAAEQFSLPRDAFPQQQQERLEPMPTA